MAHTVGLIGLLAACGAAHAATIVQSGMIAPTTTNWDLVFQIDRFDDLGGSRILEKVVVEMTGEMIVNARAENRDAIARTIILDMSAILSIEMDGTELASVNPGMLEMFEAEAFDGSINFDGESGVSLFGLTEAASAMEALEAPVDDLAAWIGGGQIDLHALASARTFGSGGGNLTTFFQTVASMEYAVTYVFQSQAVPMPPAAGFGLAGLAGLSLRRRRSA